MQTNDTSLGGPAGGFPDTTWGMLSRLRQDAGAERRSGLQALGERYWKPVYRFLRVAWAKSNDEAKDLTQEFFLWLVDEDVLKAYAAEKGSFRTFLKVLLRRFSASDARAASRIKRGGNVRTIRLDDEEFRAEEAVADPAGSDPERIFDAAWKREMIRRAIDVVRLRCETRGRGALFRLYEEYDLAGGPQPTYAQLATGHGISERSVENHLFAIREEVRREIRSELSRLTDGSAQLEQEWNDLFRS